MKLNLSPKTMWRIAIILMVLGAVAVLVSIAAALFLLVNSFVS